MCGIIGLITSQSVDPEPLGRANDLMSHRGPNDAGVQWIESGSRRIGLGNRRLSILDLSPRGHQPMSDAGTTIVFNGEIYNFRELRQELSQKGHAFRSDSDTEAILRAYQEWGVECMKRLNGMFAFAIWDERKHHLFLARDRLGVKPLYYAPLDDGLAFGSEIKSMLQLPGVPRELDRSALSKYLTFLAVPDPLTLFKGIQKLPPGHYGIYKDGALRIGAYWDLDFPESSPISEPDACEELIHRLHVAVKRRLVSDVPVGVFMSGGLDSSLVTVLMKDMTDTPIIACSVGFGEDGLKYDIVPDDLKYARLLKATLGKDRMDYTEIVLEPKVVQNLPKLVWHLDEPLADAAVIPTYLICKAAKERATVMLSGTGGEEVFGGYPRHLAMKLARYYRQIPSILRQGILKSVIDALPASRPGPFMPQFRNLKKLTRSMREDSVRQFLAIRSAYDEEELQVLLVEPQWAEGVYDEHLKHFERAKDLSPLHQLLYVDTKTFLPSVNLTYMDKASMAASVEVREPLLDHELVEYAASLPPGLKIKGVKQKYILKKAGEKLLPKSLVWRKKSGFGAPVRAWVARDFAPFLREILSKESIERRGLVRYDAVERIFEDQRSGREDNALRIWALLNLELWMRTFMDRDGSAPISLDMAS